MKLYWFRLLLFFLFLFQKIVFAQKKYKYKYRAHLISQPSSFTAQVADTLLDPNKCVFAFQVLDKKGESVPFASILIRGSKMDTLIRSNLDGYAIVSLPLDTFSITISEIQFTSLQLQKVVGTPNTKNLVNILLGKSNALSIALIYSRRKLSESEIGSIIQDLSNEKSDNELIKNKTCYVNWEI